jgi:hypothetical protein
VLCAIAMLITEYALIQDFLESLLNPKGKENEKFKALSDTFGGLFADNNKEAGKAPIKFLGLSFSVSNVLSISYLSIATLLGFFIFELSASFKDVYRKVLQPNEPKESNTDKDKVYIGFFLAGLIILAIIQGWLGLAREEQMSAGLSTQVLLTVTGFLIPIVAGVGSMSFHIFFAQMAMLLKLILQIIKDLVIAICLKVIALVDFVSALITKTIILFLGVSGDLNKAIADEQGKLEEGKDKKIYDWLGVDAYKAMLKLRFLKRLAPVDVEKDEDGYSIYILDKLDLTSEYANAFWKKGTTISRMVFYCEDPKFQIEKSFSEMFLLRKTFKDLADDIIAVCQKQDKTKFENLTYSEISFWVMERKGVTFEDKNILVLPTF